MRCGALVLLLAAGCGGAAAPCDLTGRWMGSPVMGRFVGARVAQTFDADGSYHIELNDATFDGRYAFDGTTLTISDDASCPSDAGDGVYRPRFSGCDDAILAIVSDGCQGRMETLNGIHIIRPFR